MTENMTRSMKQQTPPPKIAEDENRTICKNDLVVVNLDNTREPFAVAKVLSINKKTGKLLVQWYGNMHCNMRGAWKPGWIHPKSGKPYYGEPPNNVHNKNKFIFTNQHPKGLCNITQDNIPLSQVSLTPVGLKLPMAVMKYLSDDKFIKWKLERTPNKMTTNMD